MNKEQHINQIISNLVTDKFRLIEIEQPARYGSRVNGIGFLGDALISINNRWKVIDTPSDYYPKNLFKQDFPALKAMLDKNKDKRVILVNKVSDDIDVVVIMKRGEYSNKLYWSIEIGLKYHNMMLRLYQYNRCDYNDTDKVDMFYDIDFNLLLSGSFIQNNEYKHYFSDHRLIRNDWSPNWYKILEPCVVDGVFYYSYFIYGQIGEHTSRAVYPKDLFTKLGVSKCIITCPYVREFDFVVPDNFIIDFEIVRPEDVNDFFYTNYTPKQLLENAIGNLPTDARKYLDSKYQTKVKKIKKDEDNLELYHDEFVLNFKYKNIESNILTNEYAYKLFIRHYKAKESIILDFAGHIVPFTYKDFLNLFKKDTGRIGKSERKAYEEFGMKIGYTDFWLSDFDSSPHGQEEVEE